MQVAGTRQPAVPDRPPFGTQAPRQVGVLVVEEQPPVEPADLVQRRRPQQGGTSAESEDVGVLGFLVLSAQPVAVAPVPRLLTMLPVEFTTRIAPGEPGSAGTSQPSSRRKLPVARCPV